MNLCRITFFLPRSASKKKSKRCYFTSLHPSVRW